MRVFVLRYWQVSQKFRCSLFRLGHQHYVFTTIGVFRNSNSTQWNSAQRVQAASVSPHRCPQIGGGGGSERETRSREQEPNLASSSFCPSLHLLCIKALAQFKYLKLPQETLAKCFSARDRLTRFPIMSGACEVLLVSWCPYVRREENKKERVQ